MALNIVLENYFEDVLYLTIRALTLVMRFKVASIFYLIFLWIIQIK